MTKLLKFENMHHFPMLVIICLYLPQALYGLYRFGNVHALYLIGLTIVSIATYYLSYRSLFNAHVFDRVVNNRIRVPFSFVSFATVAVAVYSVLMLYSALTAQDIALFAALGGAGIDRIAYAREVFLRTREGWEIALRYLYAIMVSSIMPYVIASLFVLRHRLRYLVLGLFLFSLMLTLEKSLSIIALLPVIIVSVNQRQNRRALGFITLTILCVGLASFLSRGGVTRLMKLSGIEPPATAAGSVTPGGARGAQAATEEPVESLSTVPQGYSLFTSNSQVFYIINRIVWIPYITAYDWLRFKAEVLKGGYTLGESIHFVSWVTGRPHYALEREVFNFQWGQNATGTGSSNTAFFVDAFLNFGLFGTLLYSLLVALVVKIIARSSNVAAKATAYLPLLYLAFNSFSAILFSGGLMFLLAIIMLLPTDRRMVSAEAGLAYA